MTGYMDISYNKLTSYNHLFFSDGGRMHWRGRVQSQSTRTFHADPDYIIPLKLKYITEQTYITNLFFILNLDALYTNLRSLIIIYNLENTLFIAMLRKKCVQTSVKSQRIKIPLVIIENFNYSRGGNSNNMINIHEKISIC